jgi:5-methylcytosine-specific restriction endonuclease McrA
MTEVLILNSTYEPLNVVALKRAIRLLLAGKAEIVHQSGVREVHAEVVAFPMPSVMRMLYYIANRRKTVPMTKKNILLRDDYRCGYCRRKGGPEMTVDHVTPKSRGGTSSWMNLVACCSPCNSRKRDRTPAEAGMPLKVTPRKPKVIPWIVVRRNTLPDEWGKYLSLYSVGIEERTA